MSSSSTALRLLATCLRCVPNASLEVCLIYDKSRIQSVYKCAALVQNSEQLRFLVLYNYINRVPCIRDGKMLHVASRMHLCKCYTQVSISVLFTWIVDKDWRAAYVRWSNIHMCTVKRWCMCDVAHFTETYTEHTETFSYLFMTEILRLICCRQECLQHMEIMSASLYVQVLFCSSS